MTQVTRFGQSDGHSAATFRCAACGEVAAVVKAVTAGTVTDAGDPRQDRIVVHGFSGPDAWVDASAGQYAAAQAILTSAAPDPAELRRILYWEAAPFHCPDCGLNYCHAHWRGFPRFDEGSYDCTIGICPAGHEHMIDD